MFEDCTKLSSLLGLESLGLKLNTIDFDPNNKARTHSLCDSLANFHNLTHPVRQASTILIRSEVCDLRQELAEQITVYCVKLDPVKSCFI